MLFFFSCRAALEQCMLWKSLYKIIVLIKCVKKSKICQIHLAGKNIMGPSATARTRRHFSLCLRYFWFRVYIFKNRKRKCMQSDSKSKSPLCKHERFSKETKVSVEFFYAVVHFLHIASSLKARWTASSCEHKSLIENSSKISIRRTPED